MNNILMELRENHNKAQMWFLNTSVDEIPWCLCIWYFNSNILFGLGKINVVDILRGCCLPTQFIPKIQYTQFAWSKKMKLA
jgi:hypothetical protein